jgi:endonuclease G
VLNKNGAIWSEADDEEDKKWIANEGVRVSALCRHLKAAATFNGDAARIMAMLAFAPSSSKRPGEARAVE